MLPFSNWKDTETVKLPDGTSVYEKFVSNEDSLYPVLREVSSLRRLKHDNIVELYSVKRVKNGYSIITVDAGQNLDDYLRYNVMSNSEIYRFLTQLLSAISYTHSNGIYHRDIKSTNIVIKNDKLKVIDFGIARNHIEGVTHTPKFGTWMYTAPEVLLAQEKFPHKADEWSIRFLESNNCGAKHWLYIIRDDN